MLLTKAKSSSLLVVALTLLAICLNAENANGANILGLFTSHSPSHLIIHMAVATTLAERGHNVTVVSLQEPKTTHKNIHHIVIPLSEEREQTRTALMSEVAADKKISLNAIKSWFSTISLWLNVQYDVLKNKRFLALYDDPGNKFDLVILGHFMNDYQLGVAAKFKCPVILSWVGPPMQMVNSFVGNPAEATYVPNLNIGVRVGEVMGFSKRMQNFLTERFLNVYNGILDFRMGQFYSELFSNDNLPSYKDIKKNVSLVFCNSHFSEGPVRPNVPAVVEIGGIQIREQPNLMPEDIRKFLNASHQNGAVLLSLGSNLQSSNIKPETIDILFRTLSSLKQNVLWKWDDLDRTPGNASNILYRKWLPQTDILAHPNLKLFITHAGKGSVTESQYHGVPMVALPVYADQPGNAKKLVASGYGLQRDMLQLSEADLKEAINEVLYNASYANNVQQFSQLYSDRPMTARDNVIFWTEYVIRHNGAVHMQSPLVHMSFIESFNLDIIIIMAIARHYFIKFVIKSLYRKIKKIFKSIFNKNKHQKID